MALVLRRTLQLALRGPERVQGAFYLRLARECDADREADRGDDRHDPNRRVILGKAGLLMIGKSQRTARWSCELGWLQPLCRLHDAGRSGRLLHRLRLTQRYGSRSSVAPGEGGSRLSKFCSALDGRWPKAH